MKTIHKLLNTETKILDESKGIVEYVASDESIDSDGDIVRAKGWRFTHFRKNAPFVDSHDYSSVEKLLGKVLDFEVKNGRLIETVQWAVEASDHRLAQIGWQMTKAGFLKAVSVGFRGVKMLWKADPETTAAWRRATTALGVKDDSGAHRIFLEQEQLELSSVILGSNPNAVLRMAKAYKAGALAESDLETISRELDRQEKRAANPAAADRAGVANLGRACKQFERNLETIISKL